MKALSHETRRGQAIGLAHVVALRPQIERAIELLIEMLDLADGNPDSEPDLEGACEDEGATDSGIGDYAGLMEQWPHLFQHCYQRVE